MSDKDGKYVGGLKNGLREGHGTMEWKSGNVYVGEWRHGEMAGHGKLSFADGKPLSSTHCTEGDPHGPTRLSSPLLVAGDAYEGTLQDGLPQGRGRYAFANGNTFGGAWERGQKSGRGTFRYADGRAQVGTWLADKPTDGAAWSEDRRTAWRVHNGLPTEEVSLSAAAAIAEFYSLEVP